MSGGGMGGGDIKLMAALGTWLGWRLLLIVLFLSFLVGGIGGIWLLLLKIKGGRDPIPFAPAIALALFLALVGGGLSHELLLAYALGKSSTIGEGMMRKWGAGVTPSLNSFSY